MGNEKEPIGCGDLLAILLAVAFIVMKICGVVEWGWFAVLSPLWGWAAALIIAAIILAI